MKHKIQFNTTTNSIIAANLFLLVASIINKSDALSVFALYIMETVIIGLFHIFKMIGIVFINNSGRYKIEKAPGYIGLIGMIVFFIFHFGIFVFVQTTLVLPKDSGSLFPSVITLGNYINQNNVWYLFVVALINLWAIVKYLFLDHEFMDKEFNSIFMEPYPRIFVQQFVVILGSFFLEFKGLNIGFLLVFITAKSFFEIAFSSNLQMKTNQAN
jgi:hypothetical protein